MEDALNNFIYDTFIWVLGPYKNFNAYPNYFFIGNYSIYQIFTENSFPMNFIRIRDLLIIGYLPPLVVGLSIVHSIKILRKNQLNITIHEGNIILFTISGIFMFLSALYRSDQAHITYSFPFVLVLLAIVFDAWLGVWKEFTQIKKMCLAFILFIFLIYGAYGTISRVKFASNFRYAFDTKIGRFYTCCAQEVAEYYNNLFRSVDEKIDEDRVFVYLWSSYIYFISGKENPTKYDSVIPGYNTDEQLKEIVEELEKGKVNFIFYDSIDQGLAKDPVRYSYPMAHVDLDNPLSNYVRENFIEIYKIQLDENIQQGRILKRKNKE